MTLYGTDVRLALAQRESVVFVCEDSYGWCSVNSLLRAKKELLKPKKSLIILKMKKEKDEKKNIKKRALAQINISISSW